MCKEIYRVYDAYCTGDSMLYCESIEIAEEFRKSLLNKYQGQTFNIEALTLGIPVWVEDEDCMPANHPRGIDEP